MSKALTASWQDVWLLDGVRTPFVDYNGALAQISPINLGIKAAREVFARSGASPEDVGTVITGNMAQASFGRIPAASATSGSTPACRSRRRLTWCSACAALASRC